MKMLREKGVSEEEIRELFEVQKPLSRLQVTKDYRIVLQDYGGREVKMEPIHRAVYCLFLMHPEGIRFKELPDYREELAAFYRSMKLSTQARKKVEKSIVDLTDPLKYSISEKCIRIREKFLEVMNAETARHYIISGERGKARKIRLDRSLVIWEKGNSLFH